MDYISEDANSQVLDCRRKFKMDLTRGFDGHYDHWCANVMVLFITGYHGGWWLATAADDVDGDGDVRLWS